MISTLVTSAKDHISAAFSAMHPDYRHVILSGLGFGTFLTLCTYVYFFANYWKLGRLSSYNETRALEERTATSRELRVRIINLDGGLVLQPQLLKLGPEIIDMVEWGPSMRMECYWYTFNGFVDQLTERIGTEFDDDPEGRPLITFFGSNDFHHVSLPLIRRWQQPFNIVLFDNHPDWFSNFYVGLHCGCWFNHVMKLPTAKYGFHVGGDSNIEWAGEDCGPHPWDMMRDKRLIVFPTKKKWCTGCWPEVKFDTIYPVGWWHKPDYTEHAPKKRIQELLEPYREQLAAYPLYITIDKDCLKKEVCKQNWNAGEMSLDDLLITIEVMLELSNKQLLALDVTGDFTKPNVTGSARHYCHETQHSDESRTYMQEECTLSNEYVNLKILKTVKQVLDIQ